MRDYILTEYLMEHFLIVPQSSALSVPFSMQPLSFSSFHSAADWVNALEVRWYEWESLISNTYSISYHSTFSLTENLSSMLYNQEL